MQHRADVMRVIEGAQTLAVFRGEALRLRRQPPAKLSERLYLQSVKLQVISGDQLEQYGDLVRPVSVFAPGLSNQLAKAIFGGLHLHQLSQAVQGVEIVPNVLQAAQVGAQQHMR